jgi:hypothetical protein
LLTDNWLEMTVRFIVEERTASEPTMLRFRRGRRNVRQAGD